MQKEFWTKLLRGGVALKALPGLVRSIRVAITGARGSVATASQQPFQHRMAAAWNAFNGNIFLLLSGDDYTAKEFIEYASNDAAWNNPFTHPRLQRHDLQEADHTFSSAVSRAKAEDLTLSWVCKSLAREPETSRLWCPFRAYVQFWATPESNVGSLVGQHPLKPTPSRRNSARPQSCAPSCDAMRWSVG